MYGYVYTYGSRVDGIKKYKNMRKRRSNWVPGGSFGLTWFDLLCILLSFGFTAYMIGMALGSLWRRFDWGVAVVLGLLVVVFIVLLYVIVRIIDGMEEYSNFIKKMRDKWKRK